MSAPRLRCTCIDRSGDTKHGQVRGRDTVDVAQNAGAITGEGGRDLTGFDLMALSNVERERLKQVTNQSDSNKWFYRDP